MAAPPNLNLKHIFLAATTLFRACVPSGSGYVHTLSAIAECGHRGNRAELLGFTGDRRAWEILSVHCDPWMVSLPGSHLPGHPHSLRYQIHPAEAAGRSDVSPCRYVQCFCPLPGIKPCQVLVAGEDDSNQPFMSSAPIPPKSFSRAGALYLLSCRCFHSVPHS